MTSIFDNPDNKVKSEWWSKKNVGDKIEGTLINKRVQLNQLSGKDQNIYELKLTNGEFWNVGGSIAIDAQMRQVRLGQIVGFEYIEERPNKKPGMNPTKVIQVWADPKLVDEAWIGEQEENNNTDGTQEYKEEAGPVDGVSFVDDLKKQSEAKEVPQATTPIQPTLDANAPAAGPVLTTPELIAKISTLVQEKFGITDANEIKTKVIEETTLPFVESNLPDILKKLETL